MSDNAARDAILPTPERAARLIAELSPLAVDRLNTFARDHLQTRGGRAGSGLGSLLEALWGFMLNVEMKRTREVAALDLAWFPDHAYNDFACVLADMPWDPETKTGEVFRIEAKSMYRAADESKGHFEALQTELGEYDLLLVLIWDWVPITATIPHSKVCPQILSSFVGSALEVARFRDALHEARGGTFVVAPCPDGCAPGCKHLGEPLNADGRRERRTGPKSRKPRSASYAANFGGLVRMLKTNSESARSVFRRWRAESGIVHSFVSFMHAAFPDEEVNQYRLADWRRAAETLGIPTANAMSRDEVIQAVRSHSTYMDILRTCLRPHP